MQHYIGMAIAQMSILNLMFILNFFKINIAL